jgi:serpin B
MVFVKHIGCTLAIVIALSPHASISAQAADAGQVRALTAAYNASGHDLFVKFAAKPGNIVFSPYSIGTAMAMALSGARGDTATEMARVLHQTLPLAEMDAANTGVLAILNGYDTHGAQGVCPQGSTLVPGTDNDGQRFCRVPMPREHRCPDGFLNDSGKCLIRVKDPASARFKAANALMLPKGRGDVIAADYAQALKDHYRAELFRDVDPDAINGWVNRQTEGKIDRILDRLTPNTEAVILNAVYFKAAWQVQFFESSTRDGEFNLTSTKKVGVKMMHATDRYPTVSGPGYRALRLPYSVDALSMVIVLPDEVGGATGLASDLDALRLAALFQDLKAPNLIEIAMPRIKIDFAGDLTPLFKEAGMSRAFQPGLADFSGMTGGAPAKLAIGDIKHRAVIEMNEQGTEAAAATSIAVLSSLIVPQAKPFVVDRPFLFYIVDDATGAILFQGRISDPRPQP